MPELFDAPVAEAAAIQAAVEESVLGQEGGAAAFGPDALDLAFLAGYDRERLSKMLGPFMGGRVADFAEAVDGRHPCFATLAREEGESVRRFGPVLGELLSVMDGLGEKEVALSTLRKGFLQHREFRGIRNLIASPPVRSLRDEGSRATARMKKLAKKLCCKPPLGEEPVRWVDYPSTFSPFVRGGRLKDGLQDVCRGRVEDFARLGCLGLAQRYGKRRQVVARLLEETYLGFVRVKMAIAGVVAARASGCIDFDGGGKLVWPTHHFAANPFWLKGGQQYDMQGDGVAPRRSQAMAVPSPEYIPCELHACPLHLFLPDVGEHVRKVVAALEGFGPLGGLATFDHYWVVWPAVGRGVPATTYGSMHVWCDRDQMHCCFKQEAMHAGLDAHLVKAGLVQPVLLGEADGKCYFVTVVSGGSHEREAAT